jgi:hypothetical protein
VFPEALTTIIRRLDQAREKRLLQSYALVGGFAVSVWGVARATHDIDLVVALGSSEPKALDAGGPIDLQDVGSIIAVRKPNSEDRNSLIAQADALGLAQEVRALFDLPS